MALDNAQFIAELSVTDPPGTDPLNQGDNQIRTVKRATQQSFPNVNAAVPQTAAQMAQMAIKNEQNSFTLKNFFLNRLQIDGQLTEADGLAAAPAYSFTSDPTSGFFLNAAISLDAVIGGTTVWAMSTNGMFAGSGFAIHADGALITASKPGFAFANDSDTGLFRAAANSISMAVGGLTAANWDGGTGAMWMGAGFRIRGDPASVASPSFSFTNDPDTGMFRAAANAIGFAAAGIEIMRLSNGTLSMDVRQATATGGVAINFKNSAGITAWNIQYEGSSGFQPKQFSISYFNNVTGAFISVPFYIATNGRVHTAQPILTP